MFRHSVSVFFLANMLVTSTYAGIRGGIVERSKDDISQQIVSSMVVIEIAEIVNTGGAMGESPGLVAPNRKAKAHVIKRIKGTWAGPDELEIVYNKHEIQVAPGRQLLLLDHKGNWLNLKPIRKDETVQLSNGQTLSLGDSIKELFSKPVPWP